MKRILSITSIILTCLIAYAQKPMFVGHRGSIWGVENTIESFTNGAKNGYQYLECDVKVSADTVFVLSHDNTTERLGGKLTVAESTLEQLKSETYTQTRKGVTYTGKICTLAEYLDICTRYDVRPVIELKWATGVNNNDCSNIPLLIELIRSKGFISKCIILTSMKNCLEYIRSNYPTVTLQFLTGKHWANHFDWCVEHKMDVDIQVTHFDKSTVDKFHEAGLKVNVWTINDKDVSDKHIDYGCEFITTDYLEPVR